MIKLLPLLGIFACTAVKAQVQVNYVLNPSFESHSRVPTKVDEIKFANYWSPIDTAATSFADTFGNPNCTPEYISTLSNSSEAGAPDNSRFHQYPRVGTGMAQVQMYFDESFSDPYKRDYLQGRLARTLIAGKSYCVTFFVSFNGSQAFNPSGYAVDHIGAYLDNGAIDSYTGENVCGQPRTTVTPQIYSTTVIDDAINWVKVQGQFTASGNESFITIGNFFDKAHTTAIANSAARNGSNLSWYLIDDVSVIDGGTSANAGPDRVAAHGDSVYIGTHEEGMPNDWYKLGSTTVISHSGGLWVKPDSTTNYVVEMDLCGHITRDTVKVSIDRTGFGKINQYPNLTIWPNPTNGNLTIEDAQGAEVAICDVFGKKVYNTQIRSSKEVIDISNLPKGVYVVTAYAEATAVETGVMVRRMRLVKE